MNDSAPLVYISYAHEDQQWLDKLLPWLQPLEESGEIRLFHDRTLLPGDAWEEAMRANLSMARIGILLLSPDSLAKEFINSVELPALSSRALIPVLVEDCDWQSRSDISRFQILMAD